MCRGYHQQSQKDLLEQLADDFFARIETLVNKAAWSQARYIYAFTQPKLYGNDAELQKFEALLSKCEGYGESERGEGTGRLIDWLKDSVQEIKEMKAGRELSRQWEQTQGSQ